MLLIVTVTIYANEAREHPNDMITLGAIIGIALGWTTLAIRGVEREHKRRVAALMPGPEYSWIHPDHGPVKPLRQWSPAEVLVRDTNGREVIVFRTKMHKRCPEGCLKPFCSHVTA